MFGDIGHGAIIAIIGYFLIKYEQTLKTKGFENFTKYRYLIFMMGFYACFCGLIYNDFMAIPWNLFGSCYTRTNKNNFE